MGHARTVVALREHASSLFDMQHAATPVDLQLTVTQVDLQRAATQVDVQHAATRDERLRFSDALTVVNASLSAATQVISTATHCNALQHTATHCMQHSARHCQIL